MKEKAIIRVTFQIIIILTKQLNTLFTLISSCIGGILHDEIYGFKEKIS